MLIAKVLALGTTALLGLALAAAVPPGPADEPGPPPDPKKKDRGPGGDLRKTYDLLRRVRADGRATGRSEERVKDWTDRAAKVYRDAVKASERGEDRRARELGTAAHDLARAVDHVRNATSFGADDDLPPPPGPGGRDDEGERTRRVLRHAYDRIVDLRESGGPDAGLYLNASKDLYNAARSDAVAGRGERAGELARAAEALTHVPEYLARAAEDRPEPKPKRERPVPPKEKRDRPGPDDAVPPAID